MKKLPIFIPFLLFNLLLNLSTSFAQPVLQTFSPEDDATGIPIEGDIVWTFDKNVVIADDSRIILKVSGSNAVVPASVTASGSDVIINPTENLSYLTTYYVTYLFGGITDTGGNDFGGLTSSYGFTTESEFDTKRPVAELLSPSYGAINVSRSDNIVITFDEEVQILDPGKIRIRLDSNGETWSSTPSVDGNILTINPNSTLAADTRYYVQLALGGLADLAGNNYLDMTTSIAYIFITGTELSGAPTDFNITQTSIGENNTIGSLIGSFIPIDPNGGTYSYALVDNESFPDNSAFSISGNQLIAEDVFDYESQSSYSVRVALTDEQNNVLAKTIDIAIGDRVEPVAPTDFNLTNTSFQENNAENAVISLFSVTDEDGGAYTYQLTDNASFPDNSAFYISGNIFLRASQIFDFEMKSSYSIQIELTDEAGNSLLRNFTISITDIAEVAAPTNFTLGNTSITENNAVGDLIGIFTATDTDGGSYSYELVNTGSFPDNSFFSISANQLIANTAYDFELKTSYSIQVELTDEDDNKLVRSFTINVIDENDTDNTIPSASSYTPANGANNVSISSGLSLQITYNEPILQGTNGFYQLRKFDTDQPIGGFIYPSADNVVYSGSTVTITIEEALEYNTRYYIYSSSGVVTDLALNLGDALAKGDWDFTTEAAPVVAPTDFDLSTSTLAEGNAIGDIIGSFTATDIDGGVYTYELIDNGSFPDNAAFYLENNLLKANAIYDFATQNSYDIRVRLTDEGDNQLTQEFSIGISSTDNEAPFLLSVTPDYNATFVATDANIVLTFSEPVTNGPGDISLFNAIGGSRKESLTDDLVFSGNTVTINPDNDFFENAEAYVFIESGALTDIAGNPFAGIAQGEWVISTRDPNDNVAPKLLSVSPLPDADDVQPGDNIIMEFSEDVFGESASAQIATLKSSTDGENFSLEYFLDLGDAFVTLSGNTITIDLPSDLERGKIYSLSMPGVSPNLGLEDLNENGFEGIEEGNWLFTLSKLDQTINFPEIADRSFDDFATVALSASATSGEDITYEVISGPATIVGNGEFVSFNGTGTIVVEATQAGNLTYNPAIPVRQSFTVNKADQNIIFSTISDRTFGAPDFTIDPRTVSSELSVFSEVISGPATILGNTVTITGAGVVTIEARQTGNGNYNPTSVQRSFTVNQAGQIITFTDIPDQPYTSNPINLVASSTSFLPVDFEVNFGPATIDGNKLTITGIGDISVKATQVGNENYSMAAFKTIGFEVSKASLTARADDQVITYGDPLPPYTVSYEGFAPGESISDLDQQPSTRSNATSNSDVGDYTIFIDSGNDDLYQFIYERGTLTIRPATQSIDFQDINGKVFGDEPFDLIASSSSLLPVAFELIDGPASLDGSELTILGAGEIVVSAIQVGNQNILPASIVKVIEVGKADQVISIAPIGDKEISDPTFDVSASVDSELPLTYEILSGPATINGNMITLTGTVGIVQVQVSQAGNENYNAASSTTSFIVSSPDKTDQTITFQEIDDIVFGESGTLTATASSGLTVVFTITEGASLVNKSGSELTAIGTGNVTVQATQNGDDTYNAAPTVSRSFTINKADQTISIDPIEDKSTTDSPFDVMASTDSQLSLNYSVSGPATNSGNTITLNGTEGTVTVTVSQAGSTNYLPASEQISFEVTSKENQTITFDAIANKVYGDSFTLSATASSELDVDFTVTNGADLVEIINDEVTMIGVGEVTIEASQPGNEQYNPAEVVSRSFTITISDQIISIETIEDKLTTDDPFEVVATVDSELPLSYSVEGPATNEGSTITLTGEAGTVTVTVSQAGNENYLEASESVSFEVTEPEQALAIEPAINVSYYPNPVIDRLMIEADQESTIRLIHLDGQVLIEKSMKEGYLDLSAMNAGVYLLEVTSDEQTIRKQIIKTN
ncbi:Ig-like domain-containing protein [Ekhidna sp. To15]|uniref:Ig-like domain-containing protein n=1 Tax=Ekhidna sp. To15 TaxID=3395267 RepID=UPI003F51BC82